MNVFEDIVPLQPVSDPVAVFLIILTIMLISPLLFEKLKLPSIVGLILSGILIGESGLGLLKLGENILLLSTIGLLFLMFIAGLETDPRDFKENKDKAIVFGVLTFVVPMILGTAAMMLLGYNLLAAILVASCLASHTLLALPSISKLGLSRSPAVSTTLGGTLITNVLALLVLAIVVKAFTGGLTLQFWLFLIPALIVYTFAVLWGVPKVGRWFFRRFDRDENAEFVFVLATLFIVSYAAGVIQVEPIIGAFLAGVALTSLIPSLSPLMNRIQFIGNTLFIPIFLISVGMVIDPLVLIKDPQSLIIAVVMIVVEMLSKFLAALITGKVYGYGFPSVMTIFGLSVAQAASTLAAITVAYEIDLVDTNTVNGTVMMILVTCVASPIITERWGKQIQGDAKEAKSIIQGTLGQRVLVSMANPINGDNLIKLAAIIAKSAQGGLLMPLNILDDSQPVKVEARREQLRLLRNSENIAHAANVDVETIAKIDNDVSLGIVRTAIEKSASLAVCGWGYPSIENVQFKSRINVVAYRLHIPVIIARFVQPLSSSKRIVLAVTKSQALSKDFRRALEVVKLLSEELKAEPHISLSVSKKQLKLDTSQLNDLREDISIIQTRGNFIRNTSHSIFDFDLLVLLVTGSSKGVGIKSAVGSDPEAIARCNPNTSILVIHFPS